MKTLTAKEIKDHSAKLAKVREALEAQQNAVEAIIINPREAHLVARKADTLYLEALRILDELGVGKEEK